MRLWKCHEGKNVFASVVEVCSELREFRPKLICDNVPLLASCSRRVLREDGIDKRKDDLPLPFAGIR